MPRMVPSALHSVSVVVPVYAGEDFLDQVVAELAAYTGLRSTPAGRRYRVEEVLLVHDGGWDDSPRIIRSLALEHGWVRPLWLSRNYGQHAATMAGILESRGDWVVTLDDDGQHDPRYIGAMLDAAVQARSRLVYADPVNPPHHTAFRNATSRWAKRLVDVLAGTEAARFQSFRLIEGQVARAVADRAGAGSYLDVVLGWAVGTVVTTPVELRPEPPGRVSSYDVRGLLAHFRRMVLSTGTKVLRVVAVLGVVLAALGVLLAASAALRQLVDPTGVPGWTSTMVVLLLTAGAVLFALGVVAEYVGLLVTSELGRPLFLRVDDPADGPFGLDLSGGPDHSGGGAAEAEVEVADVGDHDDDPDGDGLGEQDR